MEYKLGITSKKNKEILAFLKILSRDHAVSEFEANLRVVEHKLDDYLAQPDRPPVSDPEGVLALLDDFYVLLTKFENQLQELNRKGSLVRILNSNRLRRELEKMNSLLYEKFDVFYRRLQQSKQEAANDEIFPPDALRSQGRKGSANLNYNRTLAASSPSRRAPRGTTLASGKAALSLIINEDDREVWSKYFGASIFMVAREEFIKGLSDYLDYTPSPAETRLLFHILDNSNTGFVNVYKFSEFSKGFGPIRNCIKNMRRIFCEPWFHGFLSFEEAVRLLDDQDIGTFLVRFSRSKPGSFALAFVEPENGQVLQIEISAAERKEGDGLTSARAGFKIKEQGGDRFFNSLHELVEYYNQYFVKPLTSDIVYASWFHGDISSAEAAELLQDKEVGTFLLRFSLSQPGCFASSLVTPNGVQHALIRRTENGFQEGNTFYPTLTDFVEANRNVLKYPLPNNAQELRETVDALQAELKRGAEEEPKPDDARLIVPATGSLIMDPDGDLRGGTVEGLIERLFLDAGVNDFAQVFLLTYRKFLTPFKLLQLIIKFYNFYITRKDADAGGSSKVKRLRMCNFLKTWMERFANDFDSRMIEAYRFFVEQSVAQHEGERLAKQLSSLIDRERPKSLYRGVFVAATSPPTPIMPRNAENFGFLDLDPMEIARQLTLIEYENYSKIQSSECLNMAWTKPDKETTAPNIIRMISRFNQVSMWIATLIVSETDLRRRIEVLEHCIKTCQACVELKNFNALMEIVSGIHSFAVDRLKKTFEGLSTQCKKILADLDAMLNPDKNYKRYRDTLHKTSTPLVPFLGLYLSDLVFIETGNPDNLENNPNLINFRKCRMIARVITELQSYQQMPYNLWPVEHLKKYLLSVTPMSEQAAFAASLIAEPRQDR